MLLVCSAGSPENSSVRGAVTPEVLFVQVVDLPEQLPPLFLCLRLTKWGRSEFRECRSFQLLLSEKYEQCVTKCTLGTFVVL